MAVSLEQLNDTHELLYHVLSFCSPKENVKNTEVCKTWRDVASEVAKKQWIAQLQQDIQKKAANFLKMVPNKLEFYCPSYAELKKVKLRHTKYTLEEMYYITHYNTLSTTEKYTVCMSYFVRINPNCPALPEKAKKNLAGKVFVELHSEAHTPSWPRKSYTIHIWNPGSIRFFPIELFNLTVTGERHTVIGEKNKGTVCFALRGRLIELMIEEGQEDIRNARSINSLSMLQRNHVLRFSRDFAQTIDRTLEVSPESIDLHHLFYIAKLDGLALRHSELRRSL